MLKNTIIKKFVITWKSRIQKQNENIYTFYVDPLANKFQVRNLIEKIFNVKVDKINSLKIKSVLRNSKRNIYTKMKKKMFIRLKPGYKIGELSNISSLDSNNNLSE